MADMCSGNRQACPPSPNLFGKLDTRTPPELALGEPLDLNNNLQFPKIPSIFWVLNNKQPRSSHNKELGWLHLTPVQKTEGLGKDLGVGGINGARA